MTYNKTELKTDRYFIGRILAYIVIQNGLKYNAHDLGYSSILKNGTKR